MTFFFFLLQGNAQRREIVRDILFLYYIKDIFSPALLPLIEPLPPLAYYDDSTVMLRL